MPVLIWTSDYAAQAASWTETALQAFAPELKQAAGSAQVIAWPGATTTAGHDSAYSKETPYLAELSVNQKITGRDSTKDVRHIEISLADSGITYQPGDALGVYFLNDDKAVDAILAATGLDGATEVQLAGQSYGLKTALTEHLELTQSYPSFVEKYAQATANSELLELVKDKVALRQYLDSRQTLDVICKTLRLNGPAISRMHYVNSNLVCIRLHPLRLKWGTKYI